MSQYTRRFWAPLAASAIVLVGACSGSADKRADSTASLGTDTSLSRQLAAAGRDTAAQPQLNDVPVNPSAGAAPARTTTTTERTTTRTTTRTPATTGRTPTTTRPAPTTAAGNTVTRNAPGAGAAAGGGSVGTIPAGSTLSLSSTSRVCTNTNQVGDRITATVNEPVTGSNGATIPAGATVTLTITTLHRSENSNDPIRMEFAVNSVSFGGKTYPLDATVTTASVDRVRNQPKEKDVQKVAIGAAAGAIAGRILGKSTKATVIGGAAGAAAGAAAASATANYEGCVPSGGNIVVKLNSAAQVRA